MLKIIFGIIAVVIVGVGAIFILALGQPNTFRVERSVVVNAPADKIFPLIADFHTWSRWSPFDKIDPDMQRTFSGAAQGKGAVYAWEGKGMAGIGRMEIVDATPPGKISIKLNFSKPMKTQNSVEYLLIPEGNGTKVTWVMYGPNSYVAKLFHVFMNMDKMVGKSFDEGLARLKDIGENKQ
jgi:uncharacterized protein YndB with AHSA1/START domain